MVALYEEKRQVVMVRVHTFIGNMADSLEKATKLIIKLAELVAAGDIQIADLYEHRDKMLEDLGYMANKTKKSAIPKVKLAMKAPAMKAHMKGGGKKGRETAKIAKPTDGPSKTGQAIKPPSKVMKAMKSMKSMKVNKPSGKAMKATTGMKVNTAAMKNVEPAVTDETDL